MNSRNVRTEYRALLELDPSTHQVERCVDEVLGSVDAYLDGCGVESEECSTDVPETTCVYESPVRAAGDDALVYCGYSQQAEERADSESPWVETGDPSGIRYTVRIRRVL